MAKQAVYDYSTTASSNSDFDGTDSSGATGKVKDGDNYARSIASHIKGFANDLGGINTVAGTGDAITITLSSAPSALVDGMRLTFNASAANTTNVTLNVTPAGGAAFGSKKVLKWAAGVETALSANDIPAANALIELIYDTARDTAAGAWMLLGSASIAAATNAQAATATSTVVSLTPANLAQERGFSNAPFINLSFASSVGANTLVIALKGQDANDPSATNPVYVSFRSATLGAGSNTQLAITAATSLTISPGSTMGFTSAVAGRLWIVGFNDAGTFRLGAVNALSGTSIMALRDGIYSSTAEGGAGAADSAQVIYTGTAVTSKAMTILGYLEATEATAGTWATNPSTVQVRTPSTALPGDIVQRKPFQTGTGSTGTTVVPNDNTIPQITEGDQYMTNAFTPSSAANILAVESNCFLSSSVGNAIIMSLFRDATANALATSSLFQGTATGAAMIFLEYFGLAAATTSTTFRIRAGGLNAGTTTFNGASGVTSIFGGVANSTLNVTEIVA